MVPWRIALLAAVGIFVVFLIVKMRPRLDEEPESEEALEPLASRAERALWRRLRKLPPAAQERLLARLEMAVERGGVPSTDDAGPNDSEPGAPSGSPSAD